MDNTAKLSIIVPCYNVPLAMLKKCIESMEFIDTLMKYDVWIIDDGSKDDVVCKWVTSLGRENIHAIRQENLGPGGARNTGIEQSKGEYITFVDADDYLIYGTYYYILEKLIREQPDILCHGTLQEYSGPAIKYMMDKDICPSCCSYIIRRETLADLRFSPYIFHEDEEFCTKLHLLRAHLLTTTENGYFYRLRDNSITHNNSQEITEKRFNDFFTVMQHLQQLEIRPTYSKALQRRLDIMAMCYIITLLRDTTSIRMTIEKLKKLKSLHTYPLPFRWHGIRYFIIMLATIHPITVLLLTPFTKIALKMHNAGNAKRAFVAHIDHWKDV